LPFKKDIAFLGDWLWGTRAHGTARGDRQLFSPRVGDAPTARRQ
jgi:hypothetical protein